MGGARGGAGLKVCQDEAVEYTHRTRTTIRHPNGTEEGKCCFLKWHKLCRNRDTINQPERERG